MSSARVTLLELDIFIPYAQSLKDKRRVMNSISKRLQNAHNVSVSAVDGADKWQVGTLAIVTVSNSARHNDEQMRKILQWIEVSYPDIHITQYDILEL